MTLPSAQIVAEAQPVWDLDVQPAGCPACRRAYLAPAERLGQPCPQCARGRLEAQPAFMRVEPPELLLPFARHLAPEPPPERLPLQGQAATGGPASLRPALEAFVKDVWLRPDDFNAEALLKRAVRVFWPMWLVDADVAATWQAEMGFDYQVKSSQEAFRDGQWKTTEVVETRARWEPRCGELRRRYHNVAVPALTEAAALTALAGEYPLGEARPYAATAAHGALLRIPDLPPDSAWPQAQAALERLAAQDCQTAARAQHVRQIQLAAGYDALNWTQLLLPLYVTYYTDDDGQTQPVVVNGRTARVGGRRLASQRKGWQMAGIIAGAALAVFVLGLILSGLGALFPPLLFLGVILVVAAFGLGVGALVPAVWPGQWNRRQRGNG